MARIYVAGTMHDPRIADGSIVTALERHGHAVVSRWHDPEAWRAEREATSSMTREAIAAQNFADIDRADLVLAVPHAGHHLRGAHVEIGYAIGTGKRVVIYGDAEGFNTMTAHPLVSSVATLGMVSMEVSS